MEASRNRIHEILVNLPIGTVFTSIPLQGNKQKTFYQGICEIKVQNLDPRPSTTCKLAVVKMEIRCLQGKIVSDEEICCSTK